MKKKTKRKDVYKPHYSAVEIAMASTTQPMPKEHRDVQLANMRRGLENLRSAAEATPDDWRMVSDCVNLLETFVVNGWVEDGVEEGDGFIRDAEKALAEAGTRAMEGKPLRLDGPGLEACEAAILAYEAVIGEISQRNLRLAINQTERRVRAILAGRPAPHDAPTIRL